MVMCSFRAVGLRVTERHTSGMVPLQRSGLAENALVRKSLFKALQSQVAVPRLGEALVLLLQLEQSDVVVVHDGAGYLLQGEVIIAPVVRNQVCASRESKLETHLRVTHGVAVLFAVVTD